MENFVGIDLGTTNSAICTFNKETQQNRVWKSPEQNDVTPSAIYIDNRGNEFVGQKAYNAAPRSPDNCATLFKRLIGTTTQIELSAVDRSFTPEECSAKILKTLFGYLREEIRTSADTRTVVTVPAAFNQMQKNATMAAAEKAGIGKVQLVQEPVAAVMSYVKASGGKDGIFLIYDLGGGTLDIAIAESIRKRVNILAHGGIQMCGGRDFDRTIVDNIVRPWLNDNFDLPDNISADPKFKPLLRLATWATERAKIELSAKDKATISLDEVDIRTNALNGEEIYLDIPLVRDTFDKLIEEQINETVDAARETLSKTGYTPNDIQNIVWVGGPTHYKPLRDKVAFELGIKGDTLGVNPMIAVAEGASIFAESIDWNNVKDREDTKPVDTTSETITSGEPIFTFKFRDRTPDDTTKIVVQIDGQVPTGYEFQVDSLDSGWTSGRMPLKHGATVDITLMKPGVNTFEVIVYDDSNNIIKQDKVVIEKTVAEPGDIPASNSVFVEKVRRIGGRSIPEYLYREGDSLPLEGTIELKTGISLEAGSTESLNFKLWEGDIDDYIYDNRPIGYLQINGTDFTEGTIPVNTELKCTYRQIHGTNIEFEVEVNIGDKYRKFDNLYHFDNPIPAPLEVAEEGKQLLQRINHITELVDDSELKQERKKVEKSIRLDSEESDKDTIQKADEDNFAVKKHLFRVRNTNSN